MSSERHPTGRFMLVAWGVTLALLAFFIWELFRPVGMSVLGQWVY